MRTSLAANLTGAGYRVRRAPVLGAFLLTAMMWLGGCDTGEKQPTPRREAPRPFTLTATEDLAHRASVRIAAAEGGVVEAVDGAGTRYRLTIPPRALPGDSDISVTPLIGLKGVPGQTQHYGAQIEPAGTHLYQVAWLEIEPATPLPAGAYWLVTDGPASASSASPGFPAPGKRRGVMLMHFSGGSGVVGGPETSEVMRAGEYHGVSDAPGDISWVKWALGVAEQKYKDGLIKKETYDNDVAIAKDLIERILSQKATEELARKTGEAERQVEEGEAIARRGDLKDLDTLSAVVVEVLKLEHISQLLGQESEAGRRVLKAVFGTYLPELLKRCGTHPIPVITLIGIERQGQLLGFQSEASEIMRCLPLKVDDRVEEFDVSGRIVNISKPFSLEPVTTGGKYTVQFTPDDSTGGTYTLEGTVSREGITLKADGKGRYRVVGLEGDSPYLELTGNACITMPQVAKCESRTTILKLKTIPAG